MSAGVITVFSSTEKLVEMSNVISHMNSEELQEASPDFNSNAPDWDAIRWTHSASIYKYKYKCKKYITMVQLCFMNLVIINY